MHSQMFSSSILRSEIDELASIPYTGGDAIDRQ